MRTTKASIAGRPAAKRATAKAQFIGLLFGAAILALALRPSAWGADSPAAPPLGGLPVNVTNYPPSHPYPFDNPGYTNGQK
jgi:hypothetical protein